MRRDVIGGPRGRGVPGGTWNPDGIRSGRRILSGPASAGPRMMRPASARLPRCRLSRVRAAKRAGWPAQRREQTKKYSTASLGLMTGILAFTCMLAAVSSVRVGWPPCQLCEAGKHLSTLK